MALPCQVLLSSLDSVFASIAPSAIFQVITPWHQCRRDSFLLHQKGICLGSRTRDRRDDCKLIFQIERKARKGAKPTLKWFHCYVRLNKVNCQDICKLCKKCYYYNKVRHSINKQHYTELIYHLLAFKFKLKPNFVPQWRLFST